MQTGLLALPAPRKSVSTQLKFRCEITLTASWNTASAKPGLMPTELASGEGGAGGFGGGTGRTTAAELIRFATLATAAATSPTLTGSPLMVKPVAFTRFTSEFSVSE